MADDLLTLRNGLPLALETLDLRGIAPRKHRGHTAFNNAKVVKLFPNALEIQNVPGKVYVAGYSLDGSTDGMEDLRRELQFDGGVTRWKVTKEMCGWYLNNKAGAGLHTGPQTREAVCGTWQSWRA